MELRFDEWFDFTVGFVAIETHARACIVHEVMVAADTGFMGVVCMSEIDGQHSA